MPSRNVNAANDVGMPIARIGWWCYALIGAAAGALSGLLGVGGGILMVPAFQGWLRMGLKETIATSLACVGLLAIPGLGPFIAAGPIMAALAGAGAGGAIGGLTGALIGLGVPEYEAKRYEGLVKSGGILLSVHSDNSEWTKKGKVILERAGATDVSSTGEASADTHVHH